MRRWFVLVAVLLVGVSSFSELRLAAAFSDNMVLQRDQKVPVWGWANPGEEVTVQFAGQQAVVKAGKDGKFMVRLKKMAANKAAQAMTVQSAGGDKLEVKNVLVGEVWLCSGQSNMHMMVKNSINADEEIANANYPLIRMFLTDLKASTELQADCTGAWYVTTPENVPPFSATAFFFGRELHKKLDVPIGLIRSSWGGTCVEAWSPMESLKNFPTVMEYKADIDRQAEGFEQAAEDERYAKVLAKWQENVKAAKKEGRELKKRDMKKPKKRTDLKMSQNYPANLYNAMINPLVPYGIRGAVWYQGERNSKTIADAILYRE
ncbi:MAG: sialate O-acetylesterase [Kiritimatiellales bacterium]|nr:sialate O-acetylesterase [Kiritimatiellales bacterium]